MSVLKQIKKLSFNYDSRWYIHVPKFPSPLYFHCFSWKIWCINFIGAILSTNVQRIVFAFLKRSENMSSSRAFLKIFFYHLSCNIVSKFGSHNISLLLWNATKNCWLIMTVTNCLIVFVVTQAWYQWTSQWKATVKSCRISVKFVPETL